MKGHIQILSLILFFIFSRLALATEITTTLDRNSVSVDESFQIIFTATQSPDTEPDFSPLETNFTLINQSHKNSSSSWVNGESSQTIQWIVNVMAKQAGNLSIPSISFGKDSSQPASVLITKNTTEPTNKSNQEIFLDVEASPLTPYVQAQVTYTLRLYRRVQIAQASLNEPELEDAIIEKLGEDKNYKTTLNGISYLVTERKYAIFPQKSGSKTIKPLILNAEVLSNSQSNFNGFFNSRRTKTKQVASKDITLNVQKAPTDFKGKHWIPAEHVYVEEKWSGDVKQMKTGEPLTRTLTIFAKGSTVAQLPQLHTPPSTQNLKTYPDQPLLKEKQEVDGFLALREEKIAYIPSKAGSYSLPAIEIPWFNTKTQKMEVAKIPETTITAIASAQSSKTDAQALSPTQIDTVKTEPVIHTVENKFWMWFSLFSTCGWLTTLFFLFKKPKPKEKTQQPKTAQTTFKDSIKAIKQACKKNDQLATKKALLEWGQTKYKESSLSATASHCETNLREEINLLNKNLYTNPPVKDWDGNKFLQAFEENNKLEKNSEKPNDGLEPLYKI